MRDQFADHPETGDDDSDSEGRYGSSSTSGAPKAWRAIERYREMKELRKHLDDLLLEDTFDIDFKDLSLKGRCVRKGTNT